MLSIIWLLSETLFWGFYNDTFRCSYIFEIAYTELMKNHDPDPKLRAKPKEVGWTIGVENISLLRDSGRWILG